MYDDQDFLDMVFGVSLIMYLVFFGFLVLPYQIELGIGALLLGTFTFLVYITFLSEDSQQGFVVGVIILFGSMMFVTAMYRPAMMNEYNDRLDRACQKITEETNRTCLKSEFNRVEVCRGSVPEYDCKAYNVYEDSGGIQIVEANI